MTFLRTVHSDASEMTKRSECPKINDLRVRSLKGRSKGGATGQGSSERLYENHNLVLPMGGTLYTLVVLDTTATLWKFNPRTAGGLSHLRTVGGGADDRPPQRTLGGRSSSKTKKDGDKR